MVQGNTEREISGPREVNILWRVFPVSRETGMYDLRMISDHHIVKLVECMFGLHGVFIIHAALPWAGYIISRDITYQTIY